MVQKILYKATLFLFIFLFLPTSILGETKQEVDIPFSKLSPEIQTQLRSIFEAVKDQNFPSEDLPSPEMARSLTDCDSEKLYFGIGIESDPIKAKHCAFVEMNKNGKEPHPFSGVSMLMMIYANGKGATRNLDLALKLACFYPVGQADSNMEIQIRIERLAKLKAENWQGDNFNVCDDITSSLMGGYCSHHDARIAEAQREKKFLNITKLWNAEEKNVFYALEKSSKVFFESRSLEEVGYLGRTAQIALWTDAKERLEKDFLVSINDFEQKNFPKFKADEFQIADNELNSIYKKVISTYKILKKNDVPDCIKPEEIIQTERHWLKYRDAWITFAQKKYPEIPTDSIKVWLTTKRISMLNDLLERGQETLDINR